MNIAVGLLADPAVLLLDEPSTALDPRQRERLWEFVGGLTAGHEHRLLDPHRPGGRALCRPRPRPGRRRADLHGNPARPRGGVGGLGRGLRGGVRALPARAGPLRGAGALAAAQGPPDPAPLAAAGHPARHLPGGYRRADRAGAVGRPREAEGGVLQPGPGGLEHLQARRAGDRRRQVRRRALPVGRPDQRLEPRGGDRQGQVR